MSVIRVAVVQAAPLAFDREATLAKVRALAAEAAAPRAHLIVFPEAFVSGYPRGLDFGARIGSRSPEGREMFRRYWESSVDIPGPAVEALGGAARQAGAYLVIGVIEREGGTLYCSVLFFDPDGSLMGKHRKLMPTAAERLVWGQGDGSTMPVFDTPIGKLGAVICWENYMPMLRMHMYAQGIQIYCAPTADDRETWLSTMRHIALEGRCFVLGCNQFAAAIRLSGRLSGHPGGRPGDRHVERRELHRQPVGPDPGRPRVRRSGHPLGRPRPRRDPSGQVRLRRLGPLRPARRFPAGRQRVADPARDPADMKRIHRRRPRALPLP